MSYTTAQYEAEQAAKLAPRCHRHRVPLHDNGDHRARPWLAKGKAVYWRWTCPVAGCTRASGGATNTEGFC